MRARAQGRALALSWYSHSREWQVGSNLKRQQNEK